MLLASSGRPVLYSAEGESLKDHYLQAGLVGYSVSICGCRGMTLFIQGGSTMKNRLSGILRRMLKLQWRVDAVAESQLLIVCLCCKWGLTPLLCVNCKESR